MGAVLALARSTAKMWADGLSVTVGLWPSGVATYVADEDYAREHQVGLWTGAFIAPWDWRHRGTQTIILGAYRVPTGTARLAFSGRYRHTSEPQLRDQSELKEPRRAHLPRARRSFLRSAENGA
jgi:hypothetical protein